MFAFLVSLCLLVTVASCVDLGNPQGLHFDSNSEYASHYNNYEPRDYHFNYGVSDPHTGDHKSQWETREKGVVRGAYSLLEPDGTTRVVEYIADDNGFRAVVKKLGDSLHPIHVEAHGHHEVPVEVPVIQEALPEVDHFNAYDGQINNYETYQQAIPQEYHQEIPVPSVVYQAPDPAPYQQQEVAHQGYPALVLSPQGYHGNEQVLSHPQAPGYGYEPQGHYAQEEVLQQHQVPVQQYFEQPGVELGQYSHLIQNVQPQSVHSDPHQFLINYPSGESH